MNLALRFTPEAEKTYDTVILQLRDRWSDRFVMKFENKVSKTFSTISSTPYLYPIVDENTEVRKCILHKNCSLFYKVFDDAILIICFWDNRQDPLMV